jgi:hypothetical protein
MNLFKARVWIGTSLLPNPIHMFVNKIYLKQFISDLKLFGPEIVWK